MTLAKDCLVSQRFSESVLRNNVFVQTLDNRQTLIKDCLNFSHKKNHIWRTLANHYIIYNIFKNNNNNNLCLAKQSLAKEKKGLAKGGFF